MKRAPIADIIWLFVATRLLLVIVTYFGFILFPVPPHVYPSTPVDVNALLSSWNRWDAVHYIDIAQNGYRNFFDAAFFPLFPFLIRIVALLFGHQGYLAIGMVISNLAFLGALFVLYQIAADALGDQVGRRTLLYLSIFPTSFFFFAAYNESLFLLLTAGAFLAMRRQRWWIAGMLGLLAALTRSAGILLVFPYLYELWISRDSILTTGQGRFRNLLTISFKFLPVLLIPLGTLIYSVYCWKTFHDPFAFATVQSHWDRHTTWPWDGLFFALRELFWIQPFGSFFEAHILLDFVATISFIVLTVLGWRRLRTSYSIWIALLLLYILLSPATAQHDVLVSNQRFVIEMFPGFITLAALGSKYPRLHQALLLTFPVLLATFSILFVLNRWMV